MHLLFMIPPIWVCLIATVAVALLVICLLKKRLRKHRNFRRIAMLAILALILARPAFFGGTSELQTNNLAIYFVVDMTSSMVVEDQNAGSKYRYEQAKDDLKNIANEFPGSQFSVIALDTSIYTAIPMSYNADSVNSAIESVSPKTTKNGIGTDLSSLLEHTTKHISSFSKDNPNLSIIVFFLSDGEDNSGRQLSIDSSLASLVDGGAVFGYGSENGGKIHTIETNSWPLIVSDDCLRHSINDKSCVVSTINELNLQRIAKSLNVNYYLRDSNNLPMDAINKIKKQIQYSGSKSTDDYIDCYWVLAIILLALLLWDFYDSFNKILAERSSKHA